MVTEVFSLYSQPVLKNDLGFLDLQRDSLELIVAGRDLTVRQSPTILRSDREQGTTGAGMDMYAALFFLHAVEGFPQLSGKQVFSLQNGSLLLITSS